MIPERKELAFHNLQILKLFKLLILILIGKLSS